MARNRSVAVDMTTGNPLKILILFALPMMLSSLFQQFYNIVDMLVVGRNIGSAALAAISTSTPVANLFLSAALGVATGASVVTSQYFGAKQVSNAKTSIYTMLTFAVIAGLILSVIGICFSGIVLKWMRCPAEVLPDAKTYLRIYFLGTVFIFLYNTLNSSYNALGNSSTPLVFLIISSLLNVLLDLLFVMAFHWGVAGAAAATIISQAVSAVLSFFNMHRKLAQMENTPEATVKRFDKGVFKTTMKIAIPNALQMSIIQFGLVFIQSGVNAFGPAVMAGISAATRVESLSTMPLSNLGSSFGPYAGQNIGAGKLDRIKDGIKSLTIIIVAVGIVLIVVLQLLAPSLIGVFVDKADPNYAQMVDVGARYVRLLACFSIVFGLFMVFMSLLRGSGDMGFFLGGNLTNFAIRVFMALVLAPRFGPSMIWWGTAIGWTSALVIGAIRYFQGGWKNKAVVKRAG